MTAATQPSIEDIVLGSIPWIPKVRFHNPFLAYDNGDDFLRPFHLAAEGKLAPFILVVEGSIPNEHNKEEGYWASMGTDSKTGQPITTCDWIDRLAPLAWASGGRRHLRDVRRHPCHGREPDGLYGASRLSGLEVEVDGEHPDRVRAGLPRPAGQLHGNPALSSLHGRGTGSDDPAR